MYERGNSLGTVRLDRLYHEPRANVLGPRFFAYTLKKYYMCIFFFKKSLKINGGNRFGIKQ